MLSLLLIAVWCGTSSLGFAAGDETQQLLADLQAEPSMERRLELGAALLENIKLAPEEALAADVHFEMGLALVRLERFAEAKPQLEAAQAIAKRIGDSKILAYTGWQLGLIAFHFGEFDAGLKQAGLGAEHARLIDDKRLGWRNYNIKGLIEERMGDYAAALESFQMAVSIAEQGEEPDAVPTILGNLGIAQMNQGEYQQAYECYLRVRDLEVAAGLPHGSSQTVANLGDVCMLMNDYEQASEFHSEALRMRIEEGKEIELARSYHSLGVIHLEREEYSLALKRFGQALAIRERLGLLPDQMASLLGMSLVYSKTDEDEAAEKALSTSQGILDDLGMLGRRQAVLVALARIQAEQGLFEAALATHEESVAVAQELHTRESAKNYAEFEAQLDSKEKQRQIAVLEAERERSVALAEHDQVVRRALIAGSVSLALLALAGWLAWATLRRTHHALALANEEARRRGEELEAAANRIKRLEGMLPICSHCKSIRDEAGAWHSLERFVSRRTEASFTHSVCPTCLDAHYADALAPDEPSGHPRIQG